jgi:hypothetical protein
MVFTPQMPNTSIQSDRRIALLYRRDDLTGYPEPVPPDVGAVRKVLLTFIFGTATREKDTSFLAFSLAPCRRYRLCCGKEIRPHL